MAWKMCLAAGLIFFSSNIANSPFTDIGNPLLPKIDGNEALSSQHIDEVTLHKSAGIAQPMPASAEPFSEKNRDIEAKEFPFYAADLDLLVKTGTLNLPHPDGGVLNILLQSNSEKNGSRIFHVLSNGYPGTITQRSEGFFATLATPEGTYTLENRGSVTYLVRQRQLDLRINPGLRDYDHAPAA